MITKPVLMEKLQMERLLLPGTFVDKFKLNVMAKNLLPILQKKMKLVIY